MEKQSESFLEKEIHLKDFSKTEIKIDSRLKITTITIQEKSKESFSKYYIEGRDRQNNLSFCVGSELSNIQTEFESSSSLSLFTKVLSDSIKRESNQEIMKEIRILPKDNTNLIQDPSEEQEKPTTVAEKNKIRDLVNQNVRSMTERFLELQEQTEKVQIKQNNLILWVTHKQATNFLSSLKLFLNNLKEKKDDLPQIKKSASDLFQNLGLKQETNFNQSKNVKQEQIDSIIEQLNQNSDQTLVNLSSLLKVIFEKEKMDEKLFNFCDQLKPQRSFEIICLRINMLQLILLFEYILKDSYKIKKFELSNEINSILKNFLRNKSNYIKPFVSDLIYKLKRIFFQSFLFLSSEKFEYFQNSIEMKIKEKIKIEEEEDNLIGKRNKLSSSDSVDKKKSKKNKKKTKKKNKKNEKTKIIEKTLKGFSDILNWLSVEYKNIEITLQHDNKLFSLFFDLLFCLNKINKNDKQKQFWILSRRIMIVLTEIHKIFKSDKIFIFKIIFEFENQIYFKNISNKLNLINKVFLYDNDLFKNDKQHSQFENISKEISKNKNKNFENSELDNPKRKSSYENLNEVTNQDKDIVVSKILKEYNIEEPKDFSCWKDFELYFSLCSFVNSKFLKYFKFKEFYKNLNFKLKEYKFIKKATFISPLSIYWKFFNFSLIFDNEQINEDNDIIEKLGATQNESKKENKYHIETTLNLFENNDSKNFPDDIFEEMQKSKQKKMKLIKILNDFNFNFDFVEITKMNEFQSEFINKNLSKILSLVALNLKKIFEEFPEKIGKIAKMILEKLFFILKYVKKIEKEDYLYMCEIVNNFEISHLLINCESDVLNYVLHFLKEISNKISHDLTTIIEGIIKKHSLEIDNRKTIKYDSDSDLSIIKQISKYKSIQNFTKNLSKNNSLLFEVLDKTMSHFTERNISIIVEEFNASIKIDKISVSKFVNEIGKDFKSFGNKLQMENISDLKSLNKEIGEFINKFFNDNLIEEIILRINFLKEKLFNGEILFECLTMNKSDFFGSIINLLSQFIQFLFVLTKFTSVRKEIFRIFKFKQMIKIINVSFSLVHLCNQILYKENIFIKYTQKQSKKKLLKEENSLNHLKILLFRLRFAVHHLSDYINQSSLNNSDILNQSCKNLISLIFMNESLQMNLLTIFFSKQHFIDEEDMLEFVFLAFQKKMDHTNEFDLFFDFFDKDFTIFSNEESIMFGFNHSFEDLFKKKIFSAEINFFENLFEWIYQNGKKNRYFFKISSYFLSFSNFNFTKNFFIFMDKKLAKSVQSIENQNERSLEEFKTYLLNLKDFLQIDQFKSYSLYEKLSLELFSIPKKLKSIIKDQQNLFDLKTLLYEIYKIFFDDSIGIRTLIKDSDENKKFIEDIPIENHTENFLSMLFNEMSLMFEKMKKNQDPKFLSFFISLFECFVIILKKESKLSVFFNKLKREDISGKIFQFINYFITSTFDSKNMQSFKAEFSILTMEIILIFSDLSKPMNVFMLKKLFFNNLENQNSFVNWIENLNEQVDLKIQFNNLAKLKARKIKISFEKLVETLKTQVEIFSKKFKVKGNFNNEMPTEINQRFLFLENLIKSSEKVQKEEINSIFKENPNSSISRIMETFNIRGNVHQIFNIDFENKISLFTKNSAFQFLLINKIYLDAFYCNKYLAEKNLFDFIDSESFTTESFVSQTLSKKKMLRFRIFKDSLNLPQKNDSALLEAKFQGSSSLISLENFKKNSNIMNKEDYYRKKLRRLKQNLNVSFLLKEKTFLVEVSNLNVSNTQIINPETFLSSNIKVSNLEKEDHPIFGNDKHSNTKQNETQLSNILPSTQIFPKETRKSSDEKIVVFGNIVEKNKTLLDKKVLSSSFFDQKNFLNSHKSRSSINQQKARKNKYLEALKQEYSSQFKNIYMKGLVSISKNRSKNIVFRQNEMKFPQEFIPIKNVNEDPTAGSISHFVPKSSVSNSNVQPNANSKIVDSSNFIPFNTNQNPFSGSKPDYQSENSKQHPHLNQNLY